MHERQHEVLHQWKWTNLLLGCDDELAIFCWLLNFGILMKSYMWWACTEPLDLVCGDGSWSNQGVELFHVEGGTIKQLSRSTLYECREDLSRGPISLGRNARRNTLMKWHLQYRWSISMLPRLISGQRDIHLMLIPRLRQAHKDTGCEDTRHLVLHQGKIRQIMILVFDSTFTHDSNLQTN